MESIYSFSISTSGRAQVVELRQPPSQYRSSVSGRVILVGKPEGKILKGNLSIQELQMQSGQDRLYAEERTLKSALPKSFVVYRAGGKIVGCGFEGDIAPAGRKLIRTILSIAELPAAGKAAVHLMTVDDTVGTKSLRVERVGPARLRLVDNHYVANTANGMKINLRGSWMVKLSSTNLLEIGSLYGQEFVDARMTKSSSSSTQLSATFQHLSTQILSGASRSQVAIRGRIEPLWSRPSEQDIQRALALHTLHGLSKAEVFRLVANLGTNGQSDASGTDAFSKLRALVIVNQDATQEIGRRLKSEPVKTPQFVVYGQALISGGSPLAQEMFLEALQKRRNEPVASQKLIAELIGLVDPNEATINTLKTFSEDRAHPVLASSSTLILGRFAGRLAKNSPRQSSEIIRSLALQLVASSDTERQELYIGALGNAGQVSCLPYLKRFYKSSSQRVRAEAVAALRFVESQEVDHLICDRLIHDGSEEVRAAAVFALGFRTSSDEDIAALVFALRGDPSDRVRRSALSNLWEHRDRQPALVTVIDEVSRRDSSKDVRKMAQDLIRSDVGKK